MRDRADLYNDVDHHWSIDRKVPITVIATIIIQTLVFMFWLGGLSERVSTLEQRFTERNSLPDRTTRVEESVKSLREILARIEQKIDRVADR